MTQIDALDLRGNEIATTAGLAGLKKLRWLDLRDNQIHDFSDLAGLNDLKHLYLEGNPSTNIPDSLLELREEHLNSIGEWIRLEIDILDN